MNNRSGLLLLLTILGVLTALYFAKAVLIPFALAMLLAFILSPLIDHLERWRFTRVAAVTLVSFCVFVFLGFLTWVVITEVLNVARELPNYQNNLRVKLAAVKSPIGPGLERTWKTIEELSQELTFRETERPKAIEVEVLPS